MSGVATPTFTVVIPVRNGMATIGACIDAVMDARRHWSAPITVVMVDNGSTDATAEFVATRYGDQVLIVLDPTVRVGGARNLGAAQTRTDVIVFVDSDCVIAADYFSAAWACLEATGAGAVGHPYALPNNPQWIERTWDSLHRPPAAGWADWLYAGNLVIRREAFDLVGGFNPSLPTGEDPELGGRLRAAGVGLYQDPRIVAVHLGNPKTVAAFYRQQWWHGLGALRAQHRVWSNRPLMMTFLHIGLSVAAVAAVAFGMLDAGLSGASALAGSQAAVPGATILFRLCGNVRRFNPVTAIFLYWVYYWARGVALSSATIGIPRPPVGRT